MKDLSGYQPTFRAQFLGKHQIFLNGIPVGGLTTQKAKALLVYLCMEAPRVHQRAPLSATFWPDVPEETALHNLRQAIVLIKKSLDGAGITDEIVCSNRETVSLGTGLKLQVDARQFIEQMETLLECGCSYPERGYPIQLLQQTLQLYRGEFLHSFTVSDSDLFEDWIVIHREKCNRLAIQGGTILLRYYEARKDWNEARILAETLTKIAPWDEDFHFRLIQYLIELGQENAALAHYNTVMKYFSEELGLSPGECLINVRQDILTAQSRVNRSQGRNDRDHKLPRYSIPFVGREHEIDILEDWISDPHTCLVNIIGPSGSGKTRVAAKLAENQVALFRDGVYFVSIQDCQDEAQMVSRIMSAIEGIKEHGVDAFDDLIEWIKNRKCLLILDNSDDPRVTEIFLDQLLQKAPQIVIVVTSHTRLDMEGMKVLSMQGLSLTPKVNDEDRSEALDLFYAHIQVESMPEAKTHDFLHQARMICELVEGFPLAVALAAGQTKKIPIHHLLSELQQSMDVLNSQAVNLPNRHRSIQASFESVWQKLSDERKKKLNCLTIFQNPFTSLAVKYIFEVDPADLVDLAEASLLTWDAGDRFRFHQLIKQYARDKSSSDQCDLDLRFRRYCDWFYMQLIKQYEDHGKQNFPVFVQTVVAELGDILVALEQLIRIKDWTRVQAMIVPLFFYYESRSLFREGSDCFTALIHLCDDSPEGQLIQTMLEARAALFLLRLPDFTRASRLISAAHARSIENQWIEEQVFCLNVLCNQAQLQESMSAAEELAREAYDLATEHGYEEEIAHALYNLGFVRINKGDLAKAKEDLDQCREICIRRKNTRRLAKVLNLLADIACYQRDHDLALRFYDEALAIAQSMDNKYSESLITNNIGTIYMEQEQNERAEDYLARSLYLCREIGDKEGEAVALANLGEIALTSNDFKTSLDCNRQAVQISLECESDWGEMSARINLAETYRKLGESKQAAREIMQLIQMAIETDSMNFYHRGVVEACSQLIARKKTERVYSLLTATIDSEGCEGLTRSKAIELLQQTSNLVPDEADNDPGQVLDYLRTQFSDVDLAGNP